MDSLAADSDFLFNNLLDFSDVDDDDNTNKAPFLISKNLHKFDSDSLTPKQDQPQPMLEEELEWLSNRDAFPSIETADILLGKSFNNYSNDPKHQSPVSVLESSIGSGNIQFPVRARSQRRRRRRTSFTDIYGQPWWWCCEPKKKTMEVTGRKCEHCLTEKTPQWRFGPSGPKTLCNACGVRYKSGRLVPEYRPANSPTFSSALHSNSHRKIMDMRRRQQVYYESLDKGWIL